jgi:hypothetical protein
VQKKKRKEKKGEYNIGLNIQLFVQIEQILNIAGFIRNSTIDGTL